MTLGYVWPLQRFVYILMLLAYGSNLNAAILGACTAIVAAVLWWYYMPETGNSSDNKYSMTAQFTRNMVLLPYLLATAFFANSASSLAAGASLNQSFMMIMTSMAAMCAGIVFWGYGFDLCRP